MNTNVSVEQQKASLFIARIAFSMFVYVADVEKAEEERRRRRFSGEVAEAGSEEDTGPMDVYKYSPAQIIDGESLPLFIESDQWLM